MSDQPRKKKKAGPPGPARKRPRAKDRAVQKAEEAASGAGLQQESPAPVPPPLPAQENYTVVEGNPIPHVLIRKLLRSAMIGVVFIGVLIGVLTGQYEVVLRWAVAIETALLLIRRWFLWTL